MEVLSILRNTEMELSTKMDRTVFLTVLTWSGVSIILGKREGGREGGSGFRHHPLTILSTCFLLVYLRL